MPKFKAITLVVQTLTPIAKHIWISILETVFWNYLAKITSLKEPQLNSDSIKDITEVSVNEEKGDRECKAF